MFSLSQFLTYIAIVDITPGPNTVTAMSNGIRFGLRKTLPFIAGLFCGQSIIMTLVGLFSEALFLYLPSIRPVMLAVGCGYMLFLAYKLWTSGGISAKKAAPPKAMTLGGALLFQFMNPKLLLFALTSMSNYILPYFHTFPAIAAKAVLIPLGGVCSCTLWASFGSIFCGFYNTHAKWINRLMALALVYCAIALFL